MAQNAHWWTQLSLDEQRDYLQQHPKSEFTLQPRAFPPEALREIESALGSPELVAELTPPVDDAAQRVQNLPEAEQVSMGTMLRRAWSSKSAVAKRKAATQFALKAGLVLLTSAALTVATGVPTSFYVPLLVNINWNDIPDIRDPREMFKHFGGLFFSGLKAGLMHKIMLGGAVVREGTQPTVRTEQAVAIKSNHETDLNKTLTRLETAAVTSTASVDRCVEVARVLQRTAWLEQNIPVLGNVVVIASPQRLSLGNRAHKLLSAYTAELAGCYARAAELATAPVNRALQTVLKQHMRADPLRTGSVITRDNTGTATEFSTFEFAHPRGRLTVFGRRTNDAVEIAFTVDSLFSPRHFHKMRSRDLKGWLRSNIEVAA